MAKRKLSKATVKKGHRIARAVARKHKGKPTARDFRIGMAAAKKASRKRRKKK